MGVQWWAPRDAAKHPAVPRTSPGRVRDAEMELFLAGVQISQGLAPRWVRKRCELVRCHGGRAVPC